MEILFNGLNLNDAVNYFVETSDHENTAKPDINVQKIARTNESLFLRRNYGIRTIKMTVIIKDTTRELLDTRIDDFKQTIESEEKNLDIEYASDTRRYICSGFVEKVERYLKWARIEVKFECYKAFGEDTTSTTESFAGKTTSPYTDDIEIEGTAPAQPDIQITINSLTASSTKFMQLKNLNTLDYVKITLDDWTADDVIIISIKNKTVSRNGTIIEYLGIMPIWYPGDNNWEYTDDFDARNVDIVFSYKKKYL